MTSEHFEEVCRVMLAARGVAPADRETFIAGATADEEVRSEVRSLLAAEERGGPTFSMPAKGRTAAIRAMLTGDSERDFSKAAGPTQIGRYHIEETLGEGGMGTVYRATMRTPIVRTVALKVIKPGVGTREVIARFESERQALARMDHPHIACILDAGATDGGSPYFVMEYVAGVPITQFADDQRMTTRQRLELFELVCDAVAHAHTKAIIHRDIKPSNILAYVKEGKPAVKVIDFGIAKALAGERLAGETQATICGAAIGTLEYMSPEQAEGSPDIDTRTDIFSLGVVLYELLAGERPFDKATLSRVADAEKCRIIREVEPPRPSARLAEKRAVDEAIAKRRQSTPAALMKELRGELEWIPLMAMRKERARRYASVQALAEDVRNYLEHKPLLAGPETARYRLAKFVRRRRAGIAAASLVVLTLVGGIIGTSWQAYRATRAEAVALSAQERSERSAAELKRTLYISQMNRAGLQVQTNELPMIRSLLEPWRTSTPDQRGWEWYYLQSAANPEILTVQQPGHGTQVVAWSPDGRLLATAGRTDKRVRIMTPEGALIRELEPAHPMGLFSLAWNPGGSLIAAGDWNGNLVVWEVATGRVYRRLTEGPRTVLIKGMAWSPDGKLLAVGGESLIINIWNVEAGTLVRTLPGHGDAVDHLAWSPDGKRLASSGHFGRNPPAGQIWEVETGKPAFSPRLAAVRPMWTRDGSRIVCWVDWEARVLDATTGAELFTIAHDNRRPFAADWNTDRTLLASEGQDGLLYIWDFDQRARLRTMHGTPGPILAVSWRPGGHEIASASFEEVRLWDARVGNDQVSIQTPALVRASVWSPDDRQIASFASDGVVHVWDSETGEVLRRLDDHAGPGIMPTWDNPVAWSPDGRWIASLGSRQVLVLWDAHTGKPVRTVNSVAATTSVAFSPDGRQMASAGWDHAVHIWETETGRRLWNFPSKCGSVTWSPDGSKIAVAGITEMRVVDVATRKQVWFQAIDNEQDILAWSPDGSVLVNTSSDGTIKMRDGQTGAILRSIYGQVPRGGGVSFAPDGQRFATVGQGNSVRIWEASTGIEMVDLRLEDFMARGVAWSHDGTRLATSGSRAAERSGGKATVHDARKGYAMARQGAWRRVVQAPSAAAE
jgi:WD40 repeat protein/serine/threonine protein kinase